MNGLPIYLAIATVLCVLVSVGTRAHEDREAQAMAALKLRLDAIVSEDVEALESLIADDLHYSHTRGDVESKKEFLATVKSKRIDYLAANPRDLEVRVFGDVAVITGLSDMDLIVRGARLELAIRFLEVSRLVDGKWRLVAWQSVRFQPK